jgi:hypothetical protein
MSVYLSLTPTEGPGHDGIGAVVYHQLLLYLMAKKSGLGYTHPGFKNLSHYDYTGYSQNQICNEYTQFFNFPCLEEPYEVIKVPGISEEFLNLISEHRYTENPVVINLHEEDLSEKRVTNGLEDYFFRNIDYFYDKNVISEIKNNLIFNGKKYFFKDKFNISLHIRSFNPNDTEQDNIKRELYYPSRDTLRYENLICKLRDKYKNTPCVLNIHSQSPVINGKPEYFNSFSQFNTEDFQIVVHVNQDPWSDLYHMINSELFIMSNSSFSHIASLLNTNTVIARDNFWKYTYPSIIKVNRKYDF